MGCENTTVYLAPGVKASLRQLKITALLGDERIEITHRSQIRELEETRGWNGLCQVESRDSGESRVVRIDSRVAYGHLPENAAWWRLGEVAGGKSLDAVGGAKQFSEVLFGKSSKVLGRAAYEAVARGEGQMVSVLAGMVGGNDGSLVEPDVLARLMERLAGHPGVGLYLLEDPAAYSAGRELLSMVEPVRREQVLFEMLTQLPRAITPAVAERFGSDLVWREWIVEQGSWGVVGAVLESAGELDDETLARYEKLLRSRGIIGAVVADDMSAVYCSEFVPALGEEVAGILSAQVRDAMGLGSGVVRGAWDQAIEVFDVGYKLDALCATAPAHAAKLYEEIMQSGEVEVRRGGIASLDTLFNVDFAAASRVVRLGLSDPDDEVRRVAASLLRVMTDESPEDMGELVARALADESVEVRRSGAISLHRLSITEPEAAVRLWLNAVVDLDEDTARYALRQVALKGSRIAEADPDAVLDVLLSQYQAGVENLGTSPESGRILHLASIGLTRVGAYRSETVADVLDAALDRLEETGDSSVAAHVLPVLAAGACLHTPERGVVALQRVLALSSARAMDIGTLREETVQHALEGLAHSNSGGGIEILEELAGGPDVESARLALRALGTVAESMPGRVMDTVERALDDEREWVRRAAAGPLVEVFLAGEPRAEQAVLRVIQDDTGLEVVLEKAWDITEKNPTVARAVFQKAVDREVRLFEGSHQLMTPLIKAAPELAVEVLHTQLHGPEMEDDRYNRDMAARMLMDLHAVAPEAARALAASIPADSGTDPEILVELAAAGMPVHSPIPESLVATIRAVNADPEIASEVSSVRSYTQLVELGSRFTYSAETVQHLDNKEVLVQGEPHTTRVIRSVPELERNGDAMSNCTGGYAAALRRGEVMIAVQDTSGRVRYNAHLIPKREGWVVGEVNSFANRGGEGSGEIRVWAEQVVRGLPTTESVQDEFDRWE
jgi:hypothetical protein